MVRPAGRSCRASTAIASWSSPRAARPDGLPARPGVRASAGHGERRAARLVRVRIAVLSDIHSNLVALDAVLAAVGAVDAIWHLGDVVGYGPEPDAVVARLTEVGAIGVRGNHDAAAAGGTEIDWFNPEREAAMEWTRGGHLRDDPGLARRAPAAPAWSRTSRSSTAARAIRSGSTSRRPPWRAPGCRPSPPSTACTATPTCPIAFTMVDGRMRTLAPRAGNTVALGEGRTLLNPGSVGQPRDRDPRASYLVLDLDAGDGDLGSGRLRLRRRRRGDAGRRASADRLADRLASAPDSAIVIGGRAAPAGSQTRRTGASGSSARTPPTSATRARAS